MTEPTVGPCWLYHSEQGAKLFTTQADLDEAHATGWADSPAAALEAFEKVQAVVSKKRKRKTS